MVTKIDSNGLGHVAYTFDNGVRVSFSFKDMSYSDNYDLWKEKGFDYAKQTGFLESSTVEVMQTDGNPALNSWIHKKFGTYAGGGEPIGYVHVRHIPEILKRADSKVYRSKDEN